MPEARRSIYNAQKSMNQLNRRNSRGPEILDGDDVLQYILSFDSPNKFLLEDHPFAWHQKQALIDGMAR